LLNANIGKDDHAPEFIGWARRIEPIRSKAKEAALAWRANC
jgi:hypothetical protein